MARYYPNSHPPRLNEDLRLILDRVYSLEDQMKAVDSQNAPRATPAAKAEPGGPSNTKITGLRVKATPPLHGASPFYNQASGQLEFQTAAGAVAPPPTHVSQGQPGQIAFDSGFIYVCIGVNSWVRAALSTF